MTRITKALCDSIVKNALVKSGANAKIEAVKEKRFDWAERARIATLGGPEKAAEYAEINKNARAIYETLPQGLRDNSNIVNRRQHVYFNLAGVSIEAKLRDYAEASSHREVITADSPLCQEFYDIEAESNAANENVDQIRMQVRATVNKFTTVAKLINAWPEVKELLPAQIEQAKPNLPMIQVGELNALVGLPTE